MRINEYLIAIILLIAAALFVFKGPIEKAISDSFNETAVSIEKAGR